ncbi:uncharacterized protein K02A2.6-like [Portunus trituberculatus]|uniref:uncharacterized protein K02A2.6-like n=1 Tax=Portunus trituberculatus TaxID=210409 RepID=UPI001E1CF54F|nr:uncharacterized protein K02A2.6-like [Portunus trituberculatus]
MARWAEYFEQLFTIDPPSGQLQTAGLQILDADPSIDETAPYTDDVKEAVAKLRSGKTAGILYLQSPAETPETEQSGFIPCKLPMKKQSSQSLKLGCLKDFNLEVQFKPDVKPIFCKPRSVPFAIQDDLAKAYDAGIARGVWEPAQFNAYRTPIVPIRKAMLPGQVKLKICVCGDYSVMVNSQVETHRYPIPLPEDLMRKLGGGYCFIKIDLADAYNKIKLGGIPRGAKVNDIIKMPAPEDVKSLKSFLSSVQFYGNFLSNLATVAELLHRLTRKESVWKWDAEEQNAFEKLKELLSTESGSLRFIYANWNFLQCFEHHKPLLTLFRPTKAPPALAATRLAHWALQLSQHDYSIEHRKTLDHQNADSLSRWPASTDSSFDGEESGPDINTGCAINMVNDHVKPVNATTLQRGSTKDPVVSTVMCHCREGWPPKKTEDANNKVEDSRSIDGDIEETCCRCTSCGEHHSKLAKPATHPWVLHEKPWSQIHLDHAFNFMGSNWLVLTDAYLKYPCIHPTQSIFTKATINLLEQDFAHFGYPHTLVTDNASSFLSEEFQHWCKERNIVHLSGASYHPATNGAAECLIQTFKQALRKSALPPKAALQEFLMQYWHTPTSSGFFSPREMLNERQMRTRIDTLLSSPADVLQEKQVKEAA